MNNKKDYLSEIVDALVYSLMRSHNNENPWEMDCTEGCGCGDKRTGGCSCGKEHDKKNANPVAAAQKKAEHEIKIAESIANAPETMVIGAKALDDSDNVGLITIEYDRDDADKARITYEGGYEPFVSALAYALEAELTQPDEKVNEACVEVWRYEIYRFLCALSEDRVRAELGPKSADLLFKLRGIE